MVIPERYQIHAVTRFSKTDAECRLPAHLPFPYCACPFRQKPWHSQTAVDMVGVITLGVLAVCFQGKYLVQVAPGYKHRAPCNYLKGRKI